jgi:hypothetical protein
VARYADTKDGVLMYGDDRLRPFAYTYRDYVIRALNADTPFDRFVREQLAADRLAPPDEPWRLAALGFLTLGRMFDNNVHDVIDDRIDTVTRGVLGLTVSCARCHDHKYDPIPTADYYSLYGVFAGCDAPVELPLIAPPGATPGGEAFEAKAAPARKALRETLDRQYELLGEQARQRVADYLVTAVTTPPDISETAVYFLVLDPQDLRPPVTARWRRLLERRAVPDDPVFGPWHDLMRLPDADFATAARGVVERWRSHPSGTAPGRVNPLVRDTLAAEPLTNKADVARAYGAVLRRVYEESKAVPVAQATDADARRQLLDLVTGPAAPAYFPKAHTFHYMSRKDKDAFAGAQTKLDKLAATDPHAPPRAMVLADTDPQEPRVFVRGNPAVPGERVPRRFLRVIAGEDRPPFTHGSGRLDLALALTAPDNPLTARVIVNRAWMHLLGEPLVATPNDFGLRSGPPTHPELLDWLADEFVRDGWSLKRLVRRIVLSAIYRQASFDRPECRQADPENRLLWRANRRRLDLEAMRDTLLAVAGRLDRTLGGRPVDAAGDPGCRRRTVYGLVDRQGLPGLYRAFDFASPDQSAERRPQTTVPQQALFGLNAPFVIEQARALAERPEVAGAETPEAKVAALYRLVLGRPPGPDEVAAGRRFVAAESGGSALGAWGRYAQVLLLTNEVMFVD